MLTAHGGAMGTGRNSYRYFNEMLNIKGLDAIEVDIRRRGSSLFLGHTRIPFLKKNRIELSYVLNYCVANNIQVNCDLKRKNTVKMLYELAEKLGAKGLIYITGSVSKKEIQHLKGIRLFVNDTFYFSKFGPPRTDNLPKLKAFLDSLDCEDISGINVSKIYINKAFLETANSLGIDLSVYTVDDEPTLKMLIEEDVKNITTNNIELAVKLRSKMQEAAKGN